VGIAFLIVFGVVFVVKGFGIDKAARGFYKWVREYSPPPLPVQIASFSAAAGILLVLVGCYLGGVSVADAIPRIQPPPVELGEWLSYLPRLTGDFISESILPIVIGICVLFSGRAIRSFFERDPRLWRTIVIVVVVAWSWTIFSQAAQVLIYPEETSYMTGLVFTIIIGILLTVGVTFVSFLLHKKYAGFFREKEVEVEEFKEG